MKTSSALLAISIFLAVLILPGCSDKEDEGATYSDAPITKEVRGDHQSNDVPMPTLATGQVLNVQLVYGVDNKDENHDEWYQVELFRDGSKWHDLVRIQGIGRSSERHWDDYVFSSTNFNWQVEMAQYGTTSLDGLYILRITGSNGHLTEHMLQYQNGAWVSNAPTLSFSVP